MALVLLSLLLVTSAAAASSRAADYTRVGVKAGDWAEYNFTLTSSGQTLSGTARIDVTQVVGTYVAVTYVVTYSGQSSTTTHNGDISRGENDICSFVIAAGLSAGDPLYIGSAYTIAETTTRYVGGASRSVNCLTMSSSGTSIEVCYDKATGLIMIESYSSAYQGSTISVNIAATSTSLFPADPISPLLIGGVGIGAVALVAIVAVAVRADRRRKAAEAETVVIEPGAKEGTSGAPSVKGTEAKKLTTLSITPICPSCGAKVKPGASFCGSCGASLER